MTGKLGAYIHRVKGSGEGVFSPQTGHLYGKNRGDVKDITLVPTIN